jgi:O-antigen ligase
MPYVVACVVTVGLLPTSALRDALVAACYVVIAYTVLQLLIHPSTATVNPDGVPGWRGGFLHKNAMAPFMVFAALVIASFDRPSTRRNVALLTAVGLVVMSQSSTALGAGLVTLLVCLFVRRLAVSARPARASLLIGGLCAALLTGVLWTTIFSSFLGLRGKDTTLSSRTDVWNGVLAAIERQPWLGYGAGGVWRNPAADPGRSIMRDLGFTVYHSHNGFLEIMLLLGVIGLGLFTWLMVSTIRLGIANLREDPPTAAFAIGYVVLVAVLSITEVAVFGIWLGLLCGVHCLMSRTDARRRLAVAVT